LQWAGGKARLLKHLLPRLAATPHECYCEPFAGGLAVLFAKPRSPLEVINDFNGDLISFYLCAQRHAPEMERLLTQSITSRKLFFATIAQPGLTELERAVNFLLRNRQSFGCNMKNFGVTKVGKARALAREFITRTLALASARLDRVIIENQSYERILKNQDSPNTFFFIDPPYISTDVDNYASWSETDLRQLATRLQTLKAKWLLTMNDTPFVRELFAHCRIAAISTPNRGSNKNIIGARRMTELIIEPCNPL
jgi:DNA adenine methylase